jgi:hypothetical protein
MVNNPPGYFAATGRLTIVIPDGDVNMLLEAARHYDARNLLLDKNFPKDLAGLFAHPTDQNELEYLGDFEETHIFRIDLN